MTNDKTQSDFLYDTRLIRRNIRDGRVERNELEARLSSLPDLASQCDEIGETVFGDNKTKIALTGEFHSGESEE